MKQLPDIEQSRFMTVPLLKLFKLNLQSEAKNKTLMKTTKSCTINSKLWQISPKTAKGLMN